MQIIALLFVVLSFCFSFHAQHFLADKTGEYKGFLQLCSFGNTCDSIPFSVFIQKTSDPNRMQTKTVYFTKKSQSIAKDYDLILDTTHSDFSHYLLDEKDGILIIETLQGNTLHSTYTVDGNVYTVRTSYSSQSIDYELVVYNQNSKKVSTSVPDQETKLYTLETFPFTTVQKGKLFKTK